MQEAEPYLLLDETTFPMDPEPDSMPVLMRNTLLGIVVAKDRRRTINTIRQNDSRAECVYVFRHTIFPPHGNLSLASSRRVRIYVTQQYSHACHW